MKPFCGNVVNLDPACVGIEFSLLLVGRDNPGWVLKVVLSHSGFKTMRSDALPKFQLVQSISNFECGQRLSHIFSVEPLRAF